MAGRVQRLCGQLAERSSARQTSVTIGERIVDVYKEKTDEQATKVSVVPGRKRALQSTVERIRVVPVPKTVPRDEKTMAVPQDQSVDLAVGTPVAVKRQVPVIQTVNEEEIHDGADLGGPNVFGRGKSAEISFSSRCKRPAIQRASTCHRTKRNRTFLPGFRRNQRWRPGKPE